MAVAIHQGAVKESAPEPVTAALAPYASTGVTPEKPMPVLDTDKPQPEDLPEPVLDEEPAPTKKTRRAKK
jgi:hypothetical protein